MFWIADTIDFRVYATTLHMSVGAYHGVCKFHIELAEAPNWASPVGSVSDLRVAMVLNHSSWISNI